MSSSPTQKASSTPVSHSTIETHPLSFIPLPSYPLPPSFSIQSAGFASLPFHSHLLLSLSALLASFHSLRLLVCQIAQFSVPCLFLIDIACHYISSF